jgi:hypothetical protein
MVHDATRPLTFETLATDPLIRMVMEADGVSVDEMMAVWHAAHEAVASRRRPIPMRVAARRPAMSVPA